MLHATRVLIMAAIVTLVWASTIAAAPATHTDNQATPSQGTTSLALEPLWTIGEDEDVLLGTIERVLTLADGRVLLMDSQLSHILECSPEGEVLRELGNAGDGPGEITHPKDLVRFDDGTLGLVKVFPGQLIMLTPEGFPAGDIKLVAEEGSGGFITMHRALQSGGTLLLGASTMTMDPNTPHQSRSFFIASYDRDGTLVQTAALPFKPWKRNSLAHDRMAGILDRQARHVPGGAVAGVSPNEPCVVDMLVRDNGDIWCMTSSSMWNSPDGIFASRDRLLISGDRAYLVTGYWDAVYRVQGSEVDENAEPMSVTCFQIK